MPTSTKSKKSDGGRTRFVANTPVCILGIDGTVMPADYIIVQTRADRKSLIEVAEEKNPDKKIMVTSRRVLPRDVRGKAMVILAPSGPTTACPVCKRRHSPGVDDVSLTCCEQEFPLYWLGAKPMESATTNEKKQSASKKPSAAKAKKTATKEKKQPVPVDLDALKSLDNCELWSRSDVNFDNVNTDVRAYALLFTGDSPRKYSFNTYNGSLGRKAKELPVEAFLADTPVETPKGKKKLWYEVKDLDKAREKLTKDGYEKL